MIKQLITQWKLRKLAAQLRKPAGAAGHKTGEMMNKANATLYDFTLGCIPLQGNEQILEIGFGNGRLFHKIFDKAGNVHITGLDYSADMVKTAHEHNREYVAAGRLQLLQGSSAQMPFPDASFDVIFCINVIYFWDAPALHLQEIKRVLKPGGRFFATARSAESMRQMPFTKYGFTIWTPHQWETTIRENGLEWVKVYAHSDPSVEFKGEIVQLDSVCMEVRKP